jgi:hypothetical protein
MYAISLQNLIECAREDPGKIAALCFKGVPPRQVRELASLREGGLKLGTLDASRRRLGLIWSVAIMLDCFCRHHALARPWTAYREVLRPHAC